MRTRFAALAAIVVCGSLQAADAPKTQVLIVATYHFSNPGQDLNNVKSVDVMTPERQAELAAVSSALAKFEPTQVGVEWPQSLVSERYPQYLAGTMKPSSNEVVQLGFRLAKERGLKVVHGLDVDGDFPFEAVMTWAEKNGRKGEIDAMLAFGAKETAYISALQERLPIGGVLAEISKPEMIARNHSFYPTMLTFGSGDDQPGAKVVSAWMARNYAICARLLQAVKPGDRVVVFYGQGHVYLIQQCLREQPGVTLVDPQAYLGRLPTK